MAELLDAVEAVVAERHTNLEQLDREQLRALRARGLRLENVVSFARRQVQTRLDAMGLESARGEELALRLAIPNQPTPSVARRHVDLALSEEDVALAEEAVRELAGTRTATEVGPSEREAWLERQRSAEQTLSELRRRLHEALDAISDALIAQLVARGEPPLGGKHPGGSGSLEEPPGSYMGE
jgi:hypothetical protein